MIDTYRCPGCGQRHYGRNYWSARVQPDHYCSDCHDFSQVGEVESTRGLRCPMCGETDCDDLYEHDGLYSEGGHEITCHACDFDYRVSTAIEVTFTSPERVTIHHGDKLCNEDTWMPMSEPSHRFLCIECKRWCCACFGHGDEAEVAKEGEGVCCDC